jgi:hypothetical protein
MINHTLYNIGGQIRPVYTTAMGAVAFCCFFFSQDRYGQRNNRQYDSIPINQRAHISHPKSPRKLNF